MIPKPMKWSKPITLNQTKSIQKVLNRTKLNIWSVKPHQTIWKNRRVYMVLSYLPSKVNPMQKWKRHVNSKSNLEDASLCVHFTIFGLYTHCILLSLYRSCSRCETLNGGKGILGWWEIQIIRTSIIVINNTYMCKS